MLVITRRVGEEIVMDGEIRVVVRAVQGGKVRLGISAPPTVGVDRKEIRDLRAGLCSPAESEMVPVGDEGNGLEEPIFWPPVDLGGSD